MKTIRNIDGCYIMMSNINMPLYLQSQDNMKLFSCILLEKGDDIYQGTTIVNFTEELKFGITQLDSDYMQYPVFRRIKRLFLEIKRLS